MAAAASSSKKARTFGEENDISEEVHSALWGFVATLVPLLHFHIYLQGNEPLEAVKRVLMYAPGRCLAILGKDNCRHNPNFLTDVASLALQAEWQGTGLPEATVLQIQVATGWRGFLDAIESEYGLEVIATSVFQDSLRDRLPVYLTQVYISYTEELSMCSWCGMGAKEGLGRCSKCKVRSYCRGTECQLRDWKAGHKKLCGKPGNSENKPVFAKLPTWPNRRGSPAEARGSEPESGSGSEPGLEQRTERLLLEDPTEPLDLALLPPSWQPGDAIPDSGGSLGPSGSGIASSCRVRLRGLPATARGVATTLKIRCNVPNVTITEWDLPENGEECTVCCIVTESVGTGVQRRFRVRLDVCIDIRPGNRIVDSHRPYHLPDGTRVGEQEPLLLQGLSPANVEIIENRSLGDILRKPVPAGALDILKKGPPSVGTGETGWARSKQKGGKSKNSPKNKKKGRGGGGGGGAFCVDDAAYYELVLLPLYARAWAVLMLMAQHGSDRPVALLDKLLGCGPYFFFPRDGDAAIDHLVPAIERTCGCVGADSLAVFVACLAPSGLTKFDKLLLAECGGASLDGGSSLDGTTGITLLDENLGRLEYRFMHISRRKSCDPHGYSGAVTANPPCIPCLWLLHSRAADASAHNTDTSLEATNGTGVASGTTPLMTACMSGNMEGACFLLLRGAAATLNAGDQYGCTALHYSANALQRPEQGSRGNIKYVGPIIGLLAHFGADIDVRDPSGFTPLAAAVVVGSPMAVRALLRRSAKLNLKLQLSPGAQTSLESYCTQACSGGRGDDVAAKLTASLGAVDRSPAHRNIVDSARMVLAALEAGRRRYVCDNPGCGKAEDGVVKFRRCARCREARYCSPDCLAASWKSGHKDVCQKSDVAAGSKRKKYGIAGGSLS